jgi:small-conductance mechanosensitive channel
MFNLEVVLVYETDIDKALAIMREEAQKHSDYLDVRTRMIRKKKVSAR